jgi:hypothetical protein
MSKSPPSCLSVGRLPWTQITSMVDGQPIVFPPLSHLTGCNYEVRQSLRSYIVNPAGLSFPRPLLLHGNIHVTHKGGKPPSPLTDTMTGQQLLPAQMCLGRLYDFGHV